MEKKWFCFDESYFVLYHVNDRVCMLAYLVNILYQEAFLGRKETGRGSVRRIFCLETIGCVLHADVTLTYATRLSNVANHIQPF